MGQKYIWLAVAGGMGTLARYFLGGWVQRYASGGFPWGTLVVNSLGCLIFGLIWSLAEKRFLISGEMRGILLIGFLGGFTTFSSFAFETAQMFRNAEWTDGAINVLTQNFLGLVCLFIGLAGGRAL